MNWAKEVERINKQRYSVPAGWDTKETIAEQLQCSPDRVGDLLKPGIQSGAFEARDFSIWDEARRITVRQRCYRKSVVGSPEKASSGVTSRKKIPVEERVKAVILREPQTPDWQIAKRINGANVGIVRAVRSNI